MRIILIVCIITVFTMTGCVIRDGYHWHHWHGELKVKPVVAEAVSYRLPA